MVAACTGVICVKPSASTAASVDARRGGLMPCSWEGLGMHVCVCACIVMGAWGVISYPWSATITRWGRTAKESLASATTGAAAEAAATAAAAAMDACRFDGWGCRLGQLCE
jgi:hypothetical protein